LPENGFNAARALVGTEGTCVTVLQATVKLVPSPRQRVVAIIGFPDVFSAADCVPEALTYGPIGLEGIDQLFIDFIKRKHLHHQERQLLPEGHGWLIAEFGGDDVAEAAAAAQRLVDHFKNKGHAARVLSDEEQQKKLWAVRKDGRAAQIFPQRGV